MQIDANDPASVREWVQLQGDYVAEARKLNDEALFISGLAITSTVAALGFTSFDAHPDNLKAAGLIAGTSIVANNSLKPTDRALFYAAAADGVQCIVNRVRIYREEGRPTTALGIKGLPSEIVMFDLQTVGYDEIDNYLSIVLGFAQATGSSSPTLLQSIKAADDMRGQLGKAMAIRKGFSGDAKSAIEKIRTAVREKRPPSLTDLLTAISEVKPPEKKETTPGTPAESLNMLGAAGIAEADISALVSVILKALTEAGARLQPAQEERAQKDLLNCVAVFTSNAPK